MWSRSNTNQQKSVLPPAGFSPRNRASPGGILGRGVRQPHPGERERPQPARSVQTGDGKQDRALMPGTLDREFSEGPGDREGRIADDVARPDVARLEPITDHGAGKTAIDGVPALGR